MRSSAAAHPLALPSPRQPFVVWRTCAARRMSLPVPALAALSSRPRANPAVHRGEVTGPGLCETPSGARVRAVERLPKSGRTAAGASALPLVILPALGPGLPPGFLEADGMPPVPDKARTGRFFARRVMEFQNWTLASNARWPLLGQRRRQLLLLSLGQ